MLTIHAMTMRLQTTRVIHFPVRQLLSVRGILAHEFRTAFLRNNAEEQSYRANPSLTVPPPLCAHRSVLTHSGLRRNRSTGRPPIKCDSRISSTSSIFTNPYQTASGYTTTV